MPREWKKGEPLPQMKAGEYVAGCSGPGIEQREAKCPNERLLIANQGVQSPRCSDCFDEHRKALQRERGVT